jgi:protein-disulfide isomerase
MAQEKRDPTMTTHSSTKLTRPVSDRDHIQGASNAPVTLVEYGDYECPHCGKAFPIVEELRQLLGDRLRFVFRNFPLTQSHEHAEMAAEAAESAGAQGLFWQMHHALFTHQSSLEKPHLVRYAGQIGLDIQKFTHALAMNTFQGRVREDFMSGVRSGVNGTPTFFINGVRHDGPFDLSSLSAAIEEASELSEK